SVGLPTVAMLCVCPVSRLYTLYAPFGSDPNPPLPGMNATMSLPTGGTLIGTPCARRLYQTGVPLRSRITAYDEPLAPRFPVRYHPGVGDPAPGCGVTVIPGKSWGRQRIQYCALLPFAS